MALSMVTMVRFLVGRFACQHVAFDRGFWSPWQSLATSILVAD